MSQRGTGQRAVAHSERFRKISNRYNVNKVELMNEDGIPAFPRTPSGNGVTVCITDPSA